MKPSGWNTPFDDPIPLPGGKSLKTLSDARDYIKSHPNHDWELASLYIELAATVDRAWRYFARSTVYVVIHGKQEPKPRETWRDRRKRRQT